jgi:hypothetical protein
VPSEKDKAWFPAKISASNLGWPTRWQGWAVLLGFFVMLVPGAVFMPIGHPGYWVAYGGGLWAVAATVVWLKKEKR